jgi:hypothetical protein
VKVQLVVLYNDHVTMYYPIPQGQGWHVDAANRQIIIGRGLPRTAVPLDQVRNYRVENFQ